jgi:hypothetical protein
VLVGYDGTVRITDFGIAKALGRATHTDTGVLKGKVSYMSPEQLQFREPDHRSDLFSLGVVLFEVLAGRRLYKNRDGADGVRRILEDPPPDLGEDRPDAPPELTALLFELLAKEPDDRPADAAVVVRRLEQMLGECLVSDESIDVGTYVSELAKETLGRRREIAEAVRSTRIATASYVKSGVRTRWAVGVGAFLVAVVAAVGWVMWNDAGPGEGDQAVVASPTKAPLEEASRESETVSETTAPFADPVPEPVVVGPGLGEPALAEPEVGESMVVGPGLGEPALAEPEVGESMVEPAESGQRERAEATLADEPRSAARRRRARRTERSDPQAAAPMRAPAAMGMTSDQRSWEEW